MKQKTFFKPVRFQVSFVDAVFHSRKYVFDDVTEYSILQKTKDFSLQKAKDLYVYLFLQ